MKRIALYQQILANRPIRGPHVFFPLFNQAYQNSNASSHKLYYFLKTNDVESLKKQYSEGELNALGIVFIPERNHRFKVVHETLHLLWLLLKYRISLMHVISYSSSHDPIWTLKVLQWLKPIWRLHKTFALTYNGVPTAFRLNYAGHHKEDIKYENLFRRIAFEGIFTWFDDVEEWANTSGVFKKIPIVRTPTSRFCDIKKFYPAPNKDKIMVWAGAFVVYKRPLMFLEALANIRAQRPELLTGWKVIYIGTGLQEQEMRDAIANHGLQDIVEIRGAQKNYYELINTTMLHVSTQSVDHFPNLVINEAMASGCAVIATNIGRAHLFVQHEFNGYLTPSDDEPGLRHSLIAFLSLSDTQRDTMLKNSRLLAETVHTPDRFIQTIDAFWTEVLNRPLL
jgi:glycosyltransferase involved in cell wall biosynthesis